MKNLVILSQKWRVKVMNQYERIIDSSSQKSDYLKDVFRYRELFYFLALRDILVRYKQTALGIIWAIVRPLLTLAVFVFVFGKVAHLETHHVNYSSFILSGLLPWLLFAGSLTDTALSLVNQAPMISKIYFPRIILPMSHIMVHLVDFFIGCLLLLFLLTITGNIHQVSLLAFPFFILLTLFLCAGTGFWLSAASIRYRDSRFIIPFLVQFGLFISPIGYSSFLLPESTQIFYFLNPMAGIIEGFRWCCFGIPHSNLMLAVTMSIIITSFIFFTGFVFFRKMERTCADII